MSINMGSDDEPGYSDHEIHHIEHVVQVDETDNQTSGTEFSTASFEVTERGLDNDELAELVAMRISPFLKVVDTTAEDVGVQVADAEIGIGYNLQDSEFLQTSSADIESETENTETTRRDTDEPGQLYSTTGSIAGPLSNTTNGVGLGADGKMNDVVLNYKELTNRGPILDASDNMNSQIGIFAINVDNGIRVGYTATLYYRVHDMPEGRPRFGL